MQKSRAIIILIFCLLFVPVTHSIANVPQQNHTFSLAVLPDTQKYSRYSPEMFYAQTEWIVENVTLEDIAFTIHVGDLVDQVNEGYQWGHADFAMRILDNAGLPYSTQAGNHDILNRNTFDSDRNSGTEPYLSYFPAERTENHSAISGHSNNGFNSYFIFEGNGQEFLVLALDWRPSDESLEWAQSVLDEYTDIPTILTSHDILDVDSESDAFMTTHGNRLWEMLIADNNQIFFTVSGHNNGAAHLIQQNNDGNDVVMMLVDYQDDYRGGNGMMRVLHFDLVQGTVSAESFSPYVMGVPEAERSPEDIDRKTDPANEFVLDLSERFADLSILAGR